MTQLASRFERIENRMDRAAEDGAELKGGFGQMAERLTDLAARIGNG